MTMKIDLVEALKDIGLVQLDDYPDQRAEYKTQRAVELSVQAIDYITDQLTDTWVEQEAAAFAAAMKILERRQWRLNSDALRERLNRRFAVKEGA